MILNSIDMKKTLLLFFFCYSLVTVAQVTNEGKPISWKLKLQEIKAVQAIKLPSFDLKAIQEEDKTNDKFQAKPWRFGYKHTVDYGLENSGLWTELSNGDRVWRILFESKGALSLNFIFDKFFMPDGGKVYLYNDDRSDLLGAYTDIQNQKSGILGTWLVKGDKVWIEYYEPKKVKGLGKLHIANATHGYRTRETYQKTLGDSGDCNHDVNCPIGSDWEQHKDHNKKSVALILNNGNDWCTGALINNTNNDQKAYLLTANHCTDSQNPANWAFRFGWISPNPVCAATTASTNGPTNMSISGATIKANNANSDVALLELTGTIPPAWDRVWAGWDRTDVAPSFVVGIHHPSGDIMKISRDDTGVIKSPNGNPTAQTWEITSAGNGWEIGVTEPGSSGSPLFDDNGRIIGQLYGGGAACSGTDDNGSLDYYGRFGISWDAGGTAATQLKDWLDPTGTNVSTLESFPVLQVFAIDGAISSSIPSIACGNFDVTPTITVRNAGSTTLTSLTINWDIDNGSSTTINWTGSLAQNATENIVLSPITVTTGSHVFNVSSSNPNGGTDENTTNDSSANNFSLTDEFNTTQVHLELLTDDFSNETTWEFRDSNGTVLNSGGPYDGTTQDNTTFQESFNVSLGECYTFEIFDSEGDGICCGFGNGSYSLKADGDVVILNSTGQFGASEVTELRVDSALGINDESLERNITIFPNPTSGAIQIKIKEWISDFKYEIYNTLGQVVRLNKLQNNEIIDLGNLSNDIYFIKITEIDTNRSIVKKIVLNK
jgi:hypothetical protein